MKKLNFKIDEIMLVLIVAIIAIVISFYESSKSIDLVEAEKMAELVFDSHYLSFANDGVVDENELKQIQRIHYLTLKNELNVKNEFCIYIEDENGNIILAKGSAKLKTDLTACAE